jgi:hypothetical protein
VTLPPPKPEAQQASLQTCGSPALRNGSIQWLYESKLLALSSNCLNILRNTKAPKHPDNSSRQMFVSHGAAALVFGLFQPQRDSGKMSSDLSQLAEVPRSSIPTTAAPAIAKSAESTPASFRKPRPDSIIF